MLDEIQHVRAAGQSDRAALRDFPESLVQPPKVPLVPIIIGKPDFEEVLASAIQLRRHYNVARMRQLEPSVDLAWARTCLRTYCQAAELRGHHERAIKQALVEGVTILQLKQFAEAHRPGEDCVPV